MLTLTLDAYTLTPRGKPVSPFGGIPSWRERISYIRHELYLAGFGVDTTVANCGVQLPEALVYAADNSEKRLLDELAAKGIEMCVTEHEYIFRKELK